MRIKVSYLKQIIKEETKRLLEEVAQEEFDVLKMQAAALKQQEEEKEAPPQEVNVTDVMKAAQELADLKAQEQEKVRSPEERLEDFIRPGDMELPISQRRLKKGALRPEEQGGMSKDLQNLYRKDVLGLEPIDIERAKGTQEIVAPRHTAPSWTPDWFAKWAGGWSPKDVQPRDRQGGLFHPEGYGGEVGSTPGAMRPGSVESGWGELNKQGVFNPLGRWIVQNQPAPTQPGEDIAEKQQEFKEKAKALEGWMNSEEGRAIRGEVALGSPNVTAINIPGFGNLDPEDFFSQDIKADVQFAAGVDPEGNVIKPPKVEGFEKLMLQAMGALEIFDNAMLLSPVGKVGSKAVKKGFTELADRLTDDVGAETAERILKDAIERKALDPKTKDILKKELADKVGQWQAHPPSAPGGVVGARARQTAKLEKAADQIEVQKLVAAEAKRRRTPELSVADTESVLAAAHNSAVASAPARGMPLTGTELTNLGFDTIEAQRALNLALKNYGAGGSHANETLDHIIKALGRARIRAGNAAPGANAGAAGRNELKQLIDTSFSDLKDIPGLKSSLVGRVVNPRTGNLWTSTEADTLVRGRFDSFINRITTRTAYHRDVLPGTAGEIFNRAGVTNTERVLHEMAAGKNNEYKQLIKHLNTPGLSKSKRMNGVTITLGDAKLTVKQSAAPGNLWNKNIQRAEERIAKLYGQPGQGVKNTQKLAIARTDPRYPGWSTETHFYWNDEWTKMGLTPQLVDRILIEEGVSEGLWKFKKHALKKIPKNVAKEYEEKALALQEKLLKSGKISKRIFTKARLKQIIKEELNRFKTI